MLIAFLIFAFFVLGALLCGIAIGRTGREQLRLELANLRGKHETLIVAYQDVKQSAERAWQVAREAWSLAYQKNFDEKVITPKQHEQLEKQFDFQSIAPTYIAPEVQNCPQCFVSVRADTWPQECPACGSVFGFNEL